MSFLHIFLLVLQMLVSIALVLAILAQSSKGGALDGMIGGAASSALGSQGASDFLKKVTKWLAVGFMGIAIVLAVVVSKDGKEAGVNSPALNKWRKKVTKEAPAVPKTTPQPVKTEQGK